MGLWNKWTEPDRNGDPPYRGVKIILTALVGLLVAFPILRFIIEMSCWCGLNLSSAFRDKPPWYIISGMTTAPVLILLWYWRDGLKRAELWEKKEANRVSDEANAIRDKELSEGRQAGEADRKRVFIEHCNTLLVKLRIISSYSDVSVMSDFCLLIEDNPEYSDLGLMKLEKELDAFSISGKVQEQLKVALPRLTGQNGRLVLTPNGETDRTDLKYELDALE